MIHLDRSADTPLTEQIVNQLAGLIQGGQLLSGTRLPSIRKLAATLEVSSATVVAAYDRLVARGLAESRAASGFFVVPRPAGTVPRAPQPRHDPLDAVGLLRRMLQKPKDVIAAGSGFLPEAWLEDTLSTRLLTRVARKGRRAFVNPGSAEGYAPLRQQLALKLALAGVPAHADQIVLTFGVTHAFDLIARALLNPGDTVAVEEPGYFGLHAQLRAHGVRLLPVPRRAHGPDLPALAEACAHFRPKLFFTQTLMHNPTGTSTDVATAVELLKLAERHDLLIVEDDIYGDLYPGANATRLAQIDRLQRVIFTSSFSKLLTPNVRVGYIAAAPALLESFIREKLLSVLSTSEFDERLVHEMLADGGYRKHIERLKTRLAQHKPAVMQGLSAAGLAPLEQDYAGLLIWAALPEGVDGDLLVRDAAAHDIQLTPGSLFFPNPAQPPEGPSWLRFNTASANDARLFNYLGERVKALAGGAPATLAAARHERAGRA